MEFKILGLQRHRKTYEYLIKGDRCWGLTDLSPYMFEISKKSKDYQLGSDYSIVDKRNPETCKAHMELRSTLDERMKKLIVFDFSPLPIGKQMIEKFVKSIENPEIIEAIKKARATP